MTRSPGRGLVRVRRVSWGLVDQALVSLGSAAVSLQGASQLPVRDFGLLATAIACSYLALSVVRGTVSEVYVARLVHSGGSLPSGTAGLAQGAAIQLGGLAGCIFLVLGLLLPADGSVFLALAVTLPLLLMQDVRRALLIGVGRTRRSATSSAVAMVGQLAGGLALHLTHRVSGPALLLVWAAAVALSIAVVHLPAGRIRLHRAAREWLTAGKAYWPRFLTETAVQSVASQVPLLVLAALGAPAVVAGLRAATLLLSPVVLLHQAVGQLVVVEAGRVRRHRLGAFMLACQFGLFAVAAAWVCVVYLLPDSWMSMAIGANLGPAEQALPGMALLSGSLLMSLAPSATLRVIGRFVTAVRIRLVTAPMLLGIPILLAIVDAPINRTAGGFGAAAVLALVTWNFCAWNALTAGRHRPSTVAGLSMARGRPA